MRLSDLGHDGQKLEMLTSTGLIGSAMLILLTLFYTRYRSSPVHSPGISGGDAASRVRPVPYWLPWVGHGLSLLRDPERFVRRISERSIRDIFSLHLLGQTWNIVIHHSLHEQIYQHTDNGLSVQWWLLCRVFGADRRFKQAFLDAQQEANESVRIEQSGLRSLSTLFCAMTQSIQTHAPNLVSFSEGMVDQNPWERNGKAQLVHHGAVDVDLFALIRTFVGHAVFSPLLGSEFLDAYPGISDDLHDLDNSLRYLLLGLPRWFPLQSLAQANMARHRLDNAIDSFHNALDKTALGSEPNSPWHDMSDVSEGMQARCATWRKYDLPPAVKGPLDLQMLQTISINVNSLVCWLLLRICSAPGLVEEIRNETGSFAKATQPVQIFGKPEPPSLEFDTDGLLLSCPLLKACYYECLRLDSSPVSIHPIVRDTVITKPRKDLFGSERPTSYQLNAGEVVAIPLRLHNYDPREFRFKAKRFLHRIEGRDTRIFDGPQRPLPCADGGSMFPGRELLDTIVLAFVAGILALWDFESLVPGRWVVPGHQTMPNFLSPVDDVRIRVRRRALSVFQ